VMEKVEIEIGDLVYDYAADVYGIVLSPPSEPSNPYFISNRESEKYVWVFWFGPRKLIPIHRVSFARGYVEKISR